MKTRVAALIKINIIKRELMTDWQKLNEIYKPLHEKAIEILKSLKEKGFMAKLSYCNLHEILVEGQYKKEYFPLPEIEIENLTKSADLGITLNGGLWLEVTLQKERAAQLDFSNLSKNYSIEVYGAEDYLTDFYRAGLDASLTAEKIAKSSEKEIHINFAITNSQPRDVALIIESIKALV